MAVEAAYKFSITMLEKIEIRHKIEIEISNSSRLNQDF